MIVKNIRTKEFEDNLGIIGYCLSSFDRIQETILQLTFYFVVQKILNYQEMLSLLLNSNNVFYKKIYYLVPIKMFHFIPQNFFIYLEDLFIKDNSIINMFGSEFCYLIMQSISFNV